MLLRTALVLLQALMKNWRSGKEWTVGKGHYVVSHMLMGHYRSMEALIGSATSPEKFDQRGKRGPSHQRSLDAVQGLQVYSVSDVLVPWICVSIFPMIRRQRRLILYQDI